MSCDTWACTLEDRSAALAMAAFIVVCGILFDFAKETLEEHTKKESRPILQSFFGELMVGGFLSLLSFVLVFSEALTGLSLKLFDEKEYLPELLENIHVLLFVVFVVFMLQILVLLAFSFIQNRKWHRTEKMILRRQSGLAARKVKHKHNYKIARQELMEFDVLRRAFISGDSAAAALPGDFAFSHYLSSVLGKTIASMVAIPVAVWISVLLVFVLLWAIAGTSSVALKASLFVALIWGLVALSVIIYLKLRSIYKLLLPSIEPIDQLDGSVNNNVHLEMEEERLLIEPGISDPPYMHRKVRPCCAGKKHNRHQSLFWFGQHGPKIILRLMSAIMFINALFIAVYGAWFTTTVWGSVGNVGVRFVLYISGGVPLLVLPILLLPRNVRLLVITSKIELMKEQENIHKTLLEMRTKKIVRTIKLLHSLRMSVLAEEESEISKTAAAHHHERYEELSPEKLAEAQEVFGRFDTGDGHIDASELGAMMGSMGVQMDENTSKAVLKKIDKDGSGHISFEEFANYLATIVDINKKGDKMTEEDVEHIFKMFDTDGSGEVGIHEFEATFERLGNPMSITELQAFVREIDEDNSGTINLEEMVKFMEKYTEE